MSLILRVISPSPPSFHAHPPSEQSPHPFAHSPEPSLPHGARGSMPPGFAERSLLTHNETRHLTALATRAHYPPVRELFPKVVTCHHHLSRGEIPVARNRAAGLNRPRNAANRALTGAINALCVEVDGIAPYDAAFPGALPFDVHFALVFLVCSQSVTGILTSCQAGDQQQGQRHTVRNK